jgi:hypothetical protein
MYYRNSIICGFGMDVREVYFIPDIRIIAHTEVLLLLSAEI